MRMKNLAGLLLALVAASATAQQYPPTGRGFSGGAIDNPLGLPNGAFATPALYFTSDPDAGMLYFISGPMIQNKTSTVADGRTWTVWQNSNWAVTQWYDATPSTTSLIRMVDVGTDTPAFTVTATTGGGDSFDFDASTAGGEPSFNFALNDGGAGSVSVLNMIDTAATFATPVLHPDGLTSAPSVSFTNQTGAGLWANASDHIILQAQNLASTGCGLTLDDDEQSSTGSFFRCTSGGFPDFAEFLINWETGSHRAKIVVQDGAISSTTTFNDTETTFSQPIDLNDPGSKPSCDSSRRGWFFVDEGGAGVADTIEVCAKNASDTYAWVALASP